MNPAKHKNPARRERFLNGTTMVLALAGLPLIFTLPQVAILLWGAARFCSDRANAIRGAGETPVA